MKERLSGSALLDRARGDTALFEAVARTLVDESPAVPLVALDEADIAGWNARAAACPGGWAALFDGACGRPGPLGDWESAAAAPAAAAPVTAAPVTAAPVTAAPGAR